MARVKFSVASSNSFFFFGGGRNGPRDKTLGQVLGLVFCTQAARGKFSVALSNSSRFLYSGCEASS